MPIIILKRQFLWKSFFFQFIILLKWIQEENDGYGYLLFWWHFRTHLSINISVQIGVTQWMQPDLLVDVKKVVKFELKWLLTGSVSIVVLNIYHSHTKSSPNYIGFFFLEAICYTLTTSRRQPNAAGDFIIARIKRTQRKRFGKLTT